MRIELIAIGNEILKGTTINSNAAFLGKKLREKGYPVQEHRALPDDADVLQKELAASLERSDLVITSGGLGPTLDDLTKKIVSNLFQKELVFDEKVAEDLKERYTHLPSIEEQATVPKDTLILLNTVGTAPGMIFQEGKKCLIVLPGVPRELYAMVEKDALPFLEKNFPLKNRLFMESLHICQLPEVKVDEVLREVQAIDPSVECGIYPALGIVHVTFTTIAESKEEAEQKISPLKTAFSKKLEGFLYDAPSGKIEEALHAKMLQEHKMLAFAESCTGGVMAARITALPDASKMFLGSIVSYDNSVKEGVLGVPQKILEEKGAVSKEVVEAMVQGLFQNTTADYAAAVSGVAGPSGGSEEKPVGTVFVAIADRENVFAGKIFAKGDRGSIIEYTSNFVLSSLWKWLTHHKPPEFL